MRLKISNRKRNCKITINCKIIIFIMRFKTIINVLEIYVKNTIKLYLIKTFLFKNLIM